MDLNTPRAAVLIFVFISTFDQSTCARNHENEAHTRYEIYSANINKCCRIYPRATEAVKFDTELKAANLTKESFGGFANQLSRGTSSRSRPRRDYGSYLVVVDCRNCGISSLPVSLPVADRRVFQYILSWNNIRTIPADVFQNFTSLIRLEMIGNPVVDLTSQAFNGLTKLEGIFIDFENRAFETQVLDIAEPEKLLLPMKNLKTLNISHTRFNVDQMVRSLCNVSASLEKLYLRKIYWRTLTSSAWVVNRDFGACLKHTMLKELYLESNMITVIKYGTFSRLTHVEVLSLRENHIQGDTASLYDMAFMLRLRSLDLGLQTNIGRLDRLITKQQLSATTKNAVPDFFHKVRNTGMHKICLQYFFSSLREIKLDYCWLHPQTVDSDDLNICIGNNKLLSVDVSHNPVVHIRGQLPCTASLLYLNMRSIQSEFLHPDIFKGAISLQTLLLADSSAPQTYESDKATTMFQHNKNLVHLELARNQLRRLPRDMFVCLHSLSHLDLSNNKFKGITFTLANLTSLLNLNLSFNHLQYLEPSDVSSLQNIIQRRKNGSLILDLQENRLICNCFYFNVYLRSLYESKIYVTKASTCMLDGTQVLLAKATKKLFINCKVLSTVDKVMVFLFCLSLVATVVLTLAYRYRWRFRYAWLLTRQLIHRESSRCNETFRHDCFVSYNNHDVWWVTNELIPQLGVDPLRPPSEHNENQLNMPGNRKRFDFCLHEFHFRPGSPIIDNIVEAVETSRNTLLFVTRKFAQSGWCQFEANLAHAHYMSERRRKIIAVVHPEIVRLRKHKLPVGLDALLDTVTYLEWPLDMEGRSVFWLRLEQALRE